MEYLQLASSGLKISRIGFGCAAISGYDYGKVDDRESIDAIRKAWEAGVNLFDTSDVYGFGHVEEILAKALGNDRHEAIITTKFGINWDQSGKTFKDCSVKRMTWALEDSLRRLQVDCIPIYMVHWHDGVTPLPEIMEALGEFQFHCKNGLGSIRNPQDRLCAIALQLGAKRV
jgi:aryl-alcohol dehydrogenase-like predicted oxidoreductase